MNKHQLHDNICAIIEGCLNKEDIVYIKKEDIEQHDDIQELLGIFIPDFIIHDSIHKRNLILDIYTGSNTDEFEYKSLNFERLALFADFSIITEHNIHTELKVLRLFQDDDIMYNENSIKLMSAGYMREPRQYPYYHDDEEMPGKKKYIEHIKYIAKTVKKFTNFE